MAYLSSTQLNMMGFKRLGENVKISDKASIYNADQMEIGDHCRIDDFSVISGKICFERFTYIAPFCLIAGGDTGLNIKEFAVISYASQVFSQSSDYSGRSLTSPCIPTEFKFEKKRLVTIGRHVIIGANSVILPGVEVAEGCSIGSMTLVTKSTEPWGIYTGVPAKRMKEREKDLLDLEKKFFEEYDKCLI